MITSTPLTQIFTNIEDLSSILQPQINQCVFILENNSFYVFTGSNWDRLNSLIISDPINVIISKPIQSIEVTIQIPYKHRFRK